MSNANLKPIHVWGRNGPNPPKVAILLEELGVPYEIEDVAWDQVKQPAYVAVNPNGRVPAIRDPNNGDLVLWESGAIAEYLVERYDTAHKISFALDSADAQHARQWLFFQVSGQAPYYGQAVWFKMLHPEPLPSAVARYVNEIKRVTGVVEGHLRKQQEAGTGGVDGPWLVGGRCSYVDLCWFVWQQLVSTRIDKEEYDPADFPLVTAWLERMSKRPSVQKAMP